MNLNIKGINVWKMKANRELWRDTCWQECLFVLKTAPLPLDCDSSSDWLLLYSELASCERPCLTPIIQPGTHLISNNSRETTKCININGGLIEVVLVPRRGFQPPKWLTCDTVRRRGPTVRFTILYVTQQKMTTSPHNSSEDVTFLTDEQALCVWVCCRLALATPAHL